MAKTGLLLLALAAGKWRKAISLFRRGRVSNPTRVWTRPPPHPPAAAVPAHLYLIHHHQPPTTITTTTSSSTVACERAGAFVVPLPASAGGRQAAAAPSVVRLEAAAFTTVSGRIVEDPKGELQKVCEFGVWCLVFGV
jgi:hypothetical protein